MDHNHVDLLGALCCLQLKIHVSLTPHAEVSMQELQPMLTLPENMPLAPDGIMPERFLAATQVAMQL